MAHPQIVMFHCNRGIRNRHRGDGWQRRWFTCARVSVCLLSNAIKWYTILIFSLGCMRNYSNFKTFNVLLFLMNSPQTFLGWQQAGRMCSRLRLPCHALLLNVFGFLMRPSSRVVRVRWALVRITIFQYTSNYHIRICNNGRQAKEYRRKTTTEKQKNPFSMFCFSGNTSSVLLSLSACRKCRRTKYCPRLWMLCTRTWAMHLSLCAVS